MRRDITIDRFRLLVEQLRAGDIPETRNPLLRSMLAGGWDKPERSGFIGGNQKQEFDQCAMILDALSPAERSCPERVDWIAAQRIGRTTMTTPEAVLSLVRWFDENQESTRSGPGFRHWPRLSLLFNLGLAAVFEKRTDSLPQSQEPFNQN